MNHHYYVYIATNQRNTVLYTDVTRDIQNRAQQHTDKTAKSSFTSRYNVNKVVYYEIYCDINEAIAREKQIKAGSRMKKIILIEKANHGWRDLLR